MSGPGLSVSGRARRVDLMSAKDRGRIRLWLTHQPLQPRLLATTHRPRRSCRSHHQGEPTPRLVRSMEALTRRGRWLGLAEVDGGCAHGGDRRAGR